MSQGVNLDLARRLLKLMAEQAAPGDIGMLFSDDLRFEIPGDDNALPSIGPIRALVVADASRVVISISLSKLWIQRARYMTLETIAPLSDDPLVSVSSLAS